MPADSPARARARAAAASLARSGVDISSVSAIKAARGTPAAAAARQASRGGGISRQELSQTLRTTEQQAAVGTMAQRYGREYMPPPAQAGLPILAVPLIKEGLIAAGGYIAGQIGERFLGGGIPSGNGGTGDMDSNRYGGWTDVGVEGPGVFSPKDVTPTYYGTVTKQWVANGTLFQRNEDGTISVQRKDGTIKTYRPYKPIVFGKQLDARKLARVAKKHRSIYKELHKLFGTKTRTVKK